MVPGKGKEKEKLISSFIYLNLYLGYIKYIRNKSLNIRSKYSKVIKMLMEPEGIHCDRHKQLIFPHGSTKVTKMILLSH